MYKKHDLYPSSNKRKLFYDKFIYVIVILAPISNIPQLYKVWVEKNAVGVSSISWLFFSLISVAWIIYGMFHKDKHIIIMNIALMFMQVFIAIGAIIFK